MAQLLLGHIFERLLVSQSLKKQQQQEEEDEDEEERRRGKRWEGEEEWWRRNRIHTHTQEGGRVVMLMTFNELFKKQMKASANSLKTTTA